MTMRNAFADLATEDTVGSLLRRAIALLMSPRGYDKGLARHRVTAVIESGTVATVGNVTLVGGRDVATTLLNPTNRTSWALNHRSRIT